MLIAAPNGQSLALRLSGAGWTVLGTDHPNAPNTQAAINPCSAWIAADLAEIGTSEVALESFKSTVQKNLPGIPLAGIVNNAAVQITGKFEELSIADWHNTIAVNLLAPMAISRSLLPELKGCQGAIVNIGSIHCQLTKPGFTAYATSKAGLAGLTRAMAVELGGSIRVNAVEPAAISTPMLEDGFRNAPDGARAMLDHYHPTGRIGTAKDVADAVLFLLDPANTFVNGCVLPLGGGIHSRLHDPT